jgi:hypothetical protein
MFLYNPFKSLTVWGVVAVVVPMLVNAFDPHALSPVASQVLQACGALVGVLGLRNAHAKTVAAVADLVQQLAAKR